jgi:hypothetical protein
VKSARHEKLAVIADAAAGVIALLNIPMVALFLIGGLVGGVADTSPAENRSALVSGLVLSLASFFNGVGLWIARRGNGSRRVALGVLTINVLSVIAVTLAGVFTGTVVTATLLLFPLPVASGFAAIGIIRYPLSYHQSSVAQCQRCGYILVGLDELAPCPECGAARGTATPR